MRTVRVSTIIWGALLLVFAAVAFSVAVFDLREFQAAAVIWILTGLGGVFVLAAIAALLVRVVSRGSAAGLRAAAAPEPESPATAGNPRKKTTARDADEAQPID
jgi:hypothetical protein